MGKLTAAARSDFGKGASRRLRREGKVPAVVYGHGMKTIHVAFDAHELQLILRKKPASIEVVLEGKTENVAPRDVQINAVTREIEHVDLVVVTAAEAATLARDAAKHAAEVEAEIAHQAEVASAKAAARTERQEVEAAEGSSAPAAESAE